MRMGLREANQRFSAAMKVVRAGGEVVLTERGKPIAVLKPLPESAAGETVIRQLGKWGTLLPSLTSPEILRGGRREPGCPARRGPIA